MMRFWSWWKKLRWHWLWIPAAAAACVPSALQLQREARTYFLAARQAETQRTGHDRAHAALCREAAAHVEQLAHDSYPTASPAAQEAAAHLRRDCSGVKSEKADLGSGLFLLPDLAPGPAPLPASPASPALPVPVVSRCQDSLCGWDTICSCHGTDPTERCWGTKERCEQDAACCSARGDCKGTTAGEDTCSREVRAIGHGGNR